MGAYTVRSRILVRTRLISAGHGDKGEQECPRYRACVGMIRRKHFRFYDIAMSNGGDIEVAIALLN